MTSTTTKAYFAINWAYLGGSVWWVAMSAAALTDSTFVEFYDVTKVSMVLATVSVGWLLVSPASRNARVLAVAAPAMACLFRLVNYIGLDPPLWAGTIQWVGWFLVWLFIMPRHLPPPLTNGERLHYERRRTGG